MILRNYTAGSVRHLRSGASCKLDKGALPDEEVRVLPDTGMDLLCLDWPAVAHAVEVLAVDDGGEVPCSEHAVRIASKHTNHGLVERKAY